MILGMWVLGGGGGSSSRVVARAGGGTPAHTAGTRPSGAVVSSRTPRTTVQPTRGRGWSGWSGARRPSADPGRSVWSSGGGRVLMHSGGGGGWAGGRVLMHSGGSGETAGAGAAGSATT